MSDEEDFKEWISLTKSFELDGETLYLPTGDTPYSRDEMLDLWQRWINAGRTRPVED